MSYTIGESRVRLSTLLYPILLAGMALVCWVALPGAVYAQAAVESVDEAGCGCHSEESDAWQDSAHGRLAEAAGELQGPTCEDCHGAYVRGHPDDGVMALAVDSAVCTDCHTETYAQWLGSKHADEGVQCIGCHLTHSQTLRVESDKLCASCHRQSPADAFHTAHRMSDVTCTGCHVSPGTVGATGSAAAIPAGDLRAPVHDFTDVNEASCLDCHREQIGDNGAFGSSDRAMTELMTVANRVPNLRARLKDVEDQNHALASVTYVALGLGIGVGAVMGMILVLAVGTLAQREER